MRPCKRNAHRLASQDLTFEAECVGNLLVGCPQADHQHRTDDPQVVLQRRHTVFDTRLQDAVEKQASDTEQEAAQTPPGAAVEKRQRQFSPPYQGAVVIIQLIGDESCLCSDTRIATPRLHPA